MRAVAPVSHPVVRERNPSPLPGHPLRNAPWFVALVCVLGCGPQAPPEKAAPAKAAVGSTPAPQPSTKTGPTFRYAPTFSKAVPQGTHATLVAEIGVPDRGQVRFIAAVARGAEAPALEVWTFDQNNAKQELQPSGEPARLFGTPEGARSPALAELRRQMATPAAKTVRALGIDVETPEALLQRLAEHARTVADDQATAQQRAEALAGFATGLDDRLLLGQDRSAALAQDMAKTPWTLAESSASGTRRSEGTLSGSPARRVSFLRRSGGWTLAEVDKPKAKPEPGDEPPAKADTKSP